MKVTNRDKSCSFHWRSVVYPMLLVSSHPTFLERNLKVPFQDPSHADGSWKGTLRFLSRIHLHVMDPGKEPSDDDEAENWTLINFWIQSEATKCLKPQVVLTLSLPACHCRQWKYWRIFASAVAKGLKSIFVSVMVDCEDGLREYTVEGELSSSRYSCKWNMEKG